MEDEIRHQKSNLIMFCGAMVALAGIVALLFVPRNGFFTFLIGLSILFYGGFRK